MASAFVASRFTLPHDDTPASATRASVTGTGDDGAASVAGARVHLPFSSLSSFLFPTLPPSCFCFSLCALPLSLFLFIFYPNHTHRALHSAPSPPHCMFTFSAAVVVVCRMGEAPYAPALPTSGHGSGVRVALFSLVRCPAAPRLHTHRQAQGGLPLGAGIVSPSLANAPRSARFPLRFTPLVPLSLSFSLGRMRHCELDYPSRGKHTQTLAIHDDEAT